MATIIIRLDDQADGSMQLRTWSSAQREPWDLTRADRTSAERYATAAHTAIQDLQAMANAAGQLLE